jgi:hypothetical protein
MISLQVWDFGEAANPTLDNYPKSNPSTGELFNDRRED